MKAAVKMSRTRFRPIELTNRCEGGGASGGGRWEVGGEWGLTHTHTHTQARWRSRGWVVGGLEEKCNKGHMTHTHTHVREVEFRWWVVGGGWWGGLKGK